MGVCGSKRVEVVVQHPTPALSAPASAAGAPTKAGPVSLEGFGDHTFAGVTADKYLKKHGVNVDMRTVSYGEERPVCTEWGESCWSRNRRVERSADG